MVAERTILETVQWAMQRLPKDASLRDLIDELETWEAIEEGLRDVREGRVLTLDELERMLQIDRIERNTAVAVEQATSLVR